MIETHDWNTLKVPYWSVVIMRVKIGVAKSDIPLLTTLQITNQMAALAGEGIFLYLEMKFNENSRRIFRIRDYSISKNAQVALRIHNGQYPSA